MLAICIDAFPAEILSQIILFSCAELISGIRRMYTLMQWRQHLTCCRLVSPRWNAIITSTPKFWTQIFVQITASGITPPPNAVSCWLDRSATLSLDLAFVVFSIPGEQPGEQSEFVEMMSVLSQAVPRWKSLHFSGHDGQILPALTNAHRLELLIVHRLEFGSRKHVEALYDTISDIPNLRALEVSCIDNVISLGMARALPLLLHSISKLNLTCIPGCWDSVWEVCRQCTSASWILLTLHRFPTRNTHTSANNSSSSPVELPNLESLELTIEQPDQTTLLPSPFPLISPNLRFLSLLVSGFPDFPLAQMTSSFISYSNPPLEDLCVSEITADGLLNLLETPAISNIPNAELGIVPNGGEDAEVMRTIVHGLIERFKRDASINKGVNSESLIVRWTNSP